MKQGNQKYPTCTGGSGWENRFAGFRCNLDWKCRLIRRSRMNFGEGGRFLP